MPLNKIRKTVMQRQVGTDTLKVARAAAEKITKDGGVRQVLTVAAFQSSI